MQNDPYRSGTFFSLVLFLAAGLCFFGINNPVPGTEHVGQVTGAFFGLIGFIVFVLSKTGALRKEVVQFAETRQKEPFRGIVFQLAVLAIGIAIGFICKANGFADRTETHVTVGPLEQAKASPIAR